MISFHLCKINTSTLGVNIWECTSVKNVACNELHFYYATLSLAYASERNLLKVFISYIYAHKSLKILKEISLFEVFGETSRFFYKP